MPKENNVYEATYHPGKDDEKSASVEYDFGSDLNEMVDKFGDKVVFSNAKSQMTVALQAGIRRCLAAGTDPQEWANSWKPGEARARGKSKAEKVKDAVTSMSLEDLRALQDSIKERAAALKGQ